MVSLKSELLAPDGPLLETTMVHEIGAPFTTVAGAVIVVIRSAAGFTLSVALAATGLEPALVVSAPTGIVFVSDAPGEEDVVSMVNVHEPLAGTVPPVSVTLEAVLLTAPPPQVVLVFGVAEVDKPAGNVSVTDATVIAAALPFETVIVSVETPLGLIEVGENALAMDAPTEVTVRLAVFEAAPVAACVEETPEVVFGFVPGSVPRTTMVTVHESDAGTVRPANVRFVWFAVNELPAAPAQVPPAVLAASIVMPASASVKVAEVSAIAFGLVMVNVIVDVPPRLPSPARRP